LSIWVLVLECEGEERIEFNAETQRGAEGGWFKRDGARAAMGHPRLADSLSHRQRVLVAGGGGLTVEILRFAQDDGIKNGRKAGITG
jgi:hypothetical protein